MSVSRGKSKDRITSPCQERVHTLQAQARERLYRLGWEQSNMGVVHVHVCEHMCVYTSVGT